MKPFGWSGLSPKELLVPSATDPTTADECQSDLTKCKSAPDSVFWVQIKTDIQKKKNNKKRLGAQVQSRSGVICKGHIKKRPDLGFICPRTVRVFYVLFHKELYGNPVRNLLRYMYDSLSLRGGKLGGFRLILCRTLTVITSYFPFSFFPLFFYELFLRHATISQK